MSPLQESRASVVYQLLDKVVAAELVSTTIKSKVVPYVDKFQLTLDSVLFDYIKVFMKYSLYLSVPPLKLLSFVCVYSSSCPRLLPTRPD